MNDACAWQWHWSRVTGHFRCWCLQEILDVEQVTEESLGLELTSENVDNVS